MTHKIISRADALDQGLEFYFSGKPCLYNQIALRRVSSQQCQCFICVAKQRHKEKEARLQSAEKYNKTRRDRDKAERVAPHTPVFIKPL